MMAVLTEEEILDRLKVIGPQIERTEQKRDRLYDEQKELVCAGDALGMTAISMARARSQKGDPKYIAEYFRQVIRKNREAPG